MLAGTAHGRPCFRLASVRLVGFHWHWSCSFLAPEGSDLSVQGAQMQSLARTDMRGECPRFTCFPIFTVEKLETVGKKKKL